jgi:hypothetical protein
MPKVRLTQVYEKEEGSQDIVDELNQAIDDGDSQFIAEYFSIGWSGPESEKVEMVREISSEEYVEDVCINAGVTARYQFKHEDSKGLKLAESYLAVSINGSDWFDTDVIMRTKEQIDKDWREFSEIQCATWIRQDKESTKRFFEWRKSRDPEDAWS